MAKNKTLKVLSTGTVAGMIAAAVLSSQAFAAVDAYSVKIGEDVLKYDKAALTESFLAAKAGEVAPLYEDFTAKLVEAKGFYAFSDAKTGKFVSYSDIQAKFLAAKAAGEAFVVDTYTESVEAQVIEVPTVKKVVVKDGKVVVETEGQVTGKLEIKSVTATNLIEAKIVFNQEVDETSAETTGNYAVSGLTVSSATLESDNKTVTLKYAAAMTNYDEYSIVVENVKNKAGVEIEDTTVKYTVSDVAIPTATITAKGNKVIEIAFSEPVQNALALSLTNLENITLDGNNIDTTVDSAVLNAAGTKLTLTFANPLVAGEHKVKIVANGTTDIADYAGYKVAPIEAKINVLPAADMPNVQSVTFNDQTKVTVKFEKGMAISTTGDLAKFYWNTTGNAADNSKTADSIKKVDDQTWEIKFTAANKPLPVGTVHFFVKDTVDYSDNKIIGNTTTANTFKSTLTVVANSTPRATSVTSAKDTEIKVKFNNDMNVTEAEKKTNYVLKDSDGEIVSLAGAGLVYSVNDKELTMTFGSALSGNYSLTVKAIKDVVDVKTVESTYSVAVNDTTAPTVGTPAWKGDTIIVTFNEKVAASGTYSALNVDNYKYNGVKLPAGTTLSLLEGGKKVKITRPSGTWTAAQNLTVGYFDATTIKTVADLKGNLLNPVSIALPAEDTSAISFAGATSKLVSTTKVEVITASNRPEWASIVASDFTVGGKTVVAASIDKDNARKIYLEVAEDDKFNAGTTGISIATKAQTMSSKDVFGAIITQASTVALTTNDIKPQLVGAVVTADDAILVQFDTYMESGTYGNMKNDLIFVQGDKTFKASDITAVADYDDAATDSKVVKFSFATGTLNIAQPVTVKTIGQDFITTTGANLAKLTANTTGITSAELAAIAVSFTDDGATANSIDGTEVITIDFNRNIDFKSIEDRDWATALTGVTATFDASDDTIVFDGVELGTLSGLNITADGTATVTITKISDRQLTVTLTANNGATAGVLAGQVKFEASSSIKSAQGVSIDENFNPVTGTNF